MKVFTSDQHALHAPQWYVADGQVLPTPDSPIRVERLLEALAKAGDFDIERGRADPTTAVAAIHDPHYLTYLQTIHAIWTAEFPGTDVMPDTFVRRGGSGGTRAPRKPSAQAGYYCFDMAAPITAGTWAAALASARCAVSAAQTLAGGDRAAYALCRPPGHHAGRDYCGGFCYLNNAALAAESLRLQGAARLAVLDIDYHHGNGTQDIFYDRSDVLFLSIHADPATQYPYFWGYADETGAGEGAGYTINFPLPRGTLEATWMKTLNAALERIRGFRPDALVVSLGVDTFAQDTVGDFGITLPGFAELGQRLAQLETPTVLVQEGGYNVEEIGTCVAAVLRPFNC